MSAALARHDHILEKAISPLGHLVKARGEGDSAFAVFESCRDAVAAAIAAQLALSSEPWPSGAEIRVRMAVHTGPVEERDGDAYGNAVNRCARLRAIAHGGQTLASQAVKAAAGEALPGDVTLLDLGLHRLKDLTEPEHVYQVCHPKLRTEFPPLESVDLFPNNLPTQVTGLVGRAEQLEAVKRRLDDARLLTLTGPPGCGKTRLALQAAAELLRDYPDGVWFVDAASIGGDDQVADAVASVLGVREPAGGDVRSALTSYLHQRRALLLLDNCEHVVLSAAELATAVLRSCPGVRVLATSQQRLRAEGEAVHHVPPLPLPPAGPSRIPLDEIARFDAVRLFVERARAVMPSFELTEDTAGAVAEICRRLDGLPLAIELAAPLVEVLDVRAMQARLRDRFRLLSDRSLARTPHHRSLRAAIDWTYELLEPAERTLFQHLSVFAGDFTLEAAEAVAAGDVDTAGVVGVLSRLVQKSVIAVVEGPGGAERYRMLDSLRRYGLDRLCEAGGEAAARRRHAKFYVEVAERAGSKMRLGGDSSEWLSRVLHDMPNFRAALRWAFGECDLDAAVRLSASLRWAPTRVGRLTAARRSLEMALEHRDRLSPELETKALTAAGAIAFAQGDYRQGRRYAEEGLAIARRLGDRAEEASALVVLGAVAAFLGDTVRAAEVFGRSLELCEEIGDRWGLAWSLTFWGAAARMAAEFDLAELRLRRAVRLFEEMDDAYGRVVPLFNLGMVERHRGNVDEAVRLCRESVEAARAAGDRVLLGSALGFLGRALLLLDAERARPAFVESLDCSRDDANKVTIAIGIEGLAACEARRERFDEAAALWGFAAAFRESFSSPMPVSERPEYEHDLARARAALGAARFDEALAEGRALSLDEALRRIRRQTGDQASTRRA